MSVTQEKIIQGIVAPKFVRDRAEKYMAYKKAIEELKVILSPELFSEFKKKQGEKIYTIEQLMLFKNIALSGKNIINHL